jgi:hypothetical protein
VPLAFLRRIFSKFFGGTPSSVASFSSSPPPLFGHCYKVTTGLSTDYANYPYEDTTLTRTRMHRHTKLLLGEDSAKAIGLSGIVQATNPRYLTPPKLYSRGRGRTQGPTAAQSIGSHLNLTRRGQNSAALFFF